MDDLTRALLGSADDAPVRILYGVATAVNTVAVAGVDTAVEMPALRAVGVGQYAAVLVAGADRLILGPVSESGQPRILLSRATAMSIGNGGGGTQITWGTSETFISHVGGSFKTGAADVITIPTGLAGDYQVTFSGEFALNSTGIRQLWIDIGSNTASGELTQVLASQNSIATLATRMVVSNVVRLDAGATLTAMAYQNSGGALNLTNMRFSAVRIGD